LVDVEGFKFPRNLYYTKDHVWTRVQPNEIRIGFTSLGQSLCKEIVHVDLPLEGEVFKQDDELASFETIKAVIKIRAPLSGKIKEVNPALLEQPDLINADPYGKGWLLAVQPSRLKEELKSLMTVKEASKYYKTIIKEERAKFGELYAEE
jgi:glycine cleavage system H protein